MPATVEVYLFFLLSSTHPHSKFFLSFFPLPKTISGQNNFANTQEDEKSYGA